MTAVVDSLADFGDPAVYSPVRVQSSTDSDAKAVLTVSKDACRNGADPFDYKVPIPAVTR